MAVFVLSRVLLRQDSEYNMNASSPVFGHPSSPFAPIRTKPPPDDAVDFLRSTALGIKTGRQLGEAPQTPLPPKQPPTHTLTHEHTCALAGHPQSRQW